MWRIAIRAILAFGLIGSEAKAGWFGYDNYEDCMLGRMKGQAQAMYPTADKACKKEFKIEVEATYSAKVVTWSYKANSLEIGITNDNSDFDVIKEAVLSFSDKACPDSKDTDFDQEQTVELSGKPIIVFLYPNPICMKTLRLWGKYK